jgi:hypothetical protein
MVDAVLEGWTETEQAIARQAFDQAYARSIEQLMASVRAKSAELDSAETIWELHDFLSIQRHTIEGRFDFRPEGILFVFARLVKDNLLQIKELEGLAADKLTKIAAMARF